MILEGQGELHLIVTDWKLKNLFGIESETYKPRIPYRETIQKQADSDGRAKLIFITHMTANRDLYASAEEIKKLDIVENVRSVIRVEDLD